MAQNQVVFNPDVFKQTTRQQWDEAAEAWNRWSPLLSRWLGPASELMFDMAHIKSGGRVLDVAAGAGEQTLGVANHVGPDGYVLATDLSAKLLDHAAANAKLAGHRNVETKLFDGEELGKLEAEPFDAAISRVGLIYFPDQHKALQGIRSQLKEGGRIGVMVYASAEKNPFFSIPVSIIRRRANLPAPLPGQPGPFSLGNPDVLRKVLVDAGFSDIQVETVDAPVRLDSALQCLQFEQESFGALHQMLSGLSPAAQDDTWSEIEQALEQFEHDGRFEGPCEMLVAAATR